MSFMHELFCKTQFPTFIFNSPAPGNRRSSSWSFILHAGQVFTEITLVQTESDYKNLEILPNDTKRTGILQSIIFVLLHKKLVNDNHPVIAKLPSIDNALFTKKN